MVSWAHQSLNPKRHFDRLRRFAQLTAECRPTYTLQWAAPPLSKLPIAMAASGPTSNSGFLDPPESSTQSVSRTVQPFLHGSLTNVTDRPTDSPGYSVCNSRPHL